MPKHVYSTFQLHSLDFTINDFQNFDSLLNFKLTCSSNDVNHLIIIFFNSNCIFFFISIKIISESIFGRTVSPTFRTLQRHNRKGRRTAACIISRMQKIEEKTFLCKSLSTTRAKCTLKT